MWYYSVSGQRGVRVRRRRALHDSGGHQSVRSTDVLFEGHLPLRVASVCGRWFGGAISCALSQRACLVSFAGLLPAVLFTTDANFDIGAAKAYG